MRRLRALAYGSLAATAVGLAGSVAFATDLGSAGGVEYRVSAREFDPPEIPKATAMCPGPTHVTGGAFVVFDPESTDVFTWNTTVPIDDGDGDHAPDDGWRVKGSGNAVRAGVAATAMCTPENHRYKVKEVPVPLGFSEAKVSCGKDSHVTGGGVSVPVGNNPTSSYPYDSGDPGNKPDDGWAAGLYIDDLGVDAGMYAICSHAMPKYRRAHEPITPGQGSALDASCSAKTHLVGAGGRLEASPETTMIMRVGAEDYPDDPGQAPDDGASSFGVRSPGSTGDGELTTFAICAK